MRRATRILAWTMFAAVGAAAAFLAASGWFGGTVFRDYPAARPQAPALGAVYLSGDVGPRLGLGGSIIAALQGRGLAVVSVNSAAYFRQTRRPDEVIALLRSAMAQARRLSGARGVVLVGHSFGADMLHVALAGLRPDERRDIAGIVYLAPGTTVEFRVSPLEMLGLTPPGPDALTTARAARVAPTACIFGRDDATSLCPALRTTGAEAIALPGGHNMRFDGTGVARSLDRVLSNFIGRAEPDTASVHLQHSLAGLGNTPPQRLGRSG